MGVHTFLLKIFCGGSVITARSPGINGSFVFFFSPPPYFWVKSLLLGYVFTNCVNQIKHCGKW